MSPARRLNDRHPFEIYILALALTSAIPAAIGVTPVPGSVAAQLPGWPARAWAVALMVGSGTALIGLAWKRPPWPMLTVTGLALEAVGLVIAGAACVVYSAAVMFSNGLPALITSGLTLAFGLACYAQAWKIRRILGLTRPT